MPGKYSQNVKTFWFHCAHFGAGYMLFEACVNGMVQGVVLKTKDKHGEVWFETRVLARGYEESEIWEEFKQTKFFEGKQVIRINGKELEEDRMTLTYEQLVGLAGMSGTPTLVWHMASSGGSLTPGKSIDIVSGMYFSVCHTGNA